MGIGRRLYRHLPSSLRPLAERLHGEFRARRTPEHERKTFRARLFRPGAFEGYVEEFESKDAATTREQAREQFDRETRRGVTFGDIRPGIGRDLYALVRSLEPEVVVETGVCNGFSTLCLLSALEENGSGRLHSIDYPHRADEPLSEFRAETFDRYGGAAIPADRDPGWIVPSDLREQWSLRIGKSQRELPRLVTGLEEIDLFVHDSEHSLPCMVFELEIAWEWLSRGGVVVADDVSWNDAFETFVDVRDAEWGYLAPDVGYARKR